ncbi:hypothetical protein BGW80DRAFT_1411075, partial [Lactifluus volemus]
TILRIVRFLFGFSDPFAMFTSLYTKAPMLPRSPLNAPTDDFDPILERAILVPFVQHPESSSASETTHPSSHPLQISPTPQLSRSRTDIGSVPPSPTPGISLSPLPYTIPSSALPLALQSTLASTTSRIDQVTPGPGLLPSTSVTGVSSAPQEVTTFIPQPNIAPSDATFNTHILSDIVEASQDLHQLVCPSKIPPQTGFGAFASLRRYSTVLSRH